MDDADGPMTAAEALSSSSASSPPLPPTPSSFSSPATRNSSASSSARSRGRRLARTASRLERERNVSEEPRATATPRRWEVRERRRREEEEREARDTAAQFGDRRQAALSAAAGPSSPRGRCDCGRSTPRRRLRRSDRRGGVHVRGKELQRASHAGRDAHVAPQAGHAESGHGGRDDGAGGRVASLSEELESALYPREMVDELVGSMGGGNRERTTPPRRPRRSRGGRPRQLSRPAVQDGLDRLDDVDRAYTRDDGDDRGDRVRPRASCDAPIVAGLRVRGGERISGRDDDGDVSEPGERGPLPAPIPAMFGRRSRSSSTALVAAPKGGGGTSSFARTRAAWWWRPR